MNKDIKKILIGEEELKAKVAELGAKITEDYKGKDLLIVCVLKGAVIFASDLIREINLPLILILWRFPVTETTPNHQEL